MRLTIETDQMSDTHNPHIRSLEQVVKEYTANHHNLTLPCHRKQANHQQKPMRSWFYRIFEFPS